MTPPPEAGDQALSSSTRWSSLSYRFPARYRVVWVAVAVLVAVTLLSSPNVFKPTSMQVVTALAAILALASIGQLLVVMQGGIDLSVPAIVTIAAAVVVKEADTANVVVVIGAALALSGVAGLINGLLITVTRLNAVIVTLATAGLYAGLLELWTGGTFSQSGRVPAEIENFATGKVGPISAIAIMAVIVLLVVSQIMGKTAIGRKFSMVGDNPLGARAIGLKAARYQIGAYALAGIAYGVAGIALAGAVGNPDSTIGSPYQLTTIVAVALGGAVLTGGPASFSGTAAAAFFLILLDQYLAVLGIDSGARVLAQGLALIVAVALVTVTSGGGGAGVDALKRRLRALGSLRTPARR
jgi:ribose transport system permease protein